ncbi:hypothetical protein [Pseudonocardia xishanensis]|uniref:Uncharacterized protein n=1 Tax=Pseudonocardia xishanensis TaxID=630995 RepID=A0ABP8RY97_9PSEU
MSPARSTTIPGPTAAELADARATLDVEISKVRTRAQAWPVRLDVDDIVETVEATAARFGRDAGRIVSGIREATRRFNHSRERNTGNQQSNIRSIEFELRHAPAQLAAAFVYFERQADLDAAVAVHREAQTALDTGQGKLDAAIAEGNLGAARALLDDVRVHLPTRVEETHLAVLDLEIEKTVAAGLDTSSRLAVRDETAAQYRLTQSDRVRRHLGLDEPQPEADPAEGARPEARSLTQEYIAMSQAVPENKPYDGPWRDMSPRVDPYLNRRGVS